MHLLIRLTFTAIDPAIIRRPVVMAVAMAAAAAVTVDQWRHRHGPEAVSAVDGEWNELFSIS